MAVARAGEAAVALRVNGTSFADIAHTLGLNSARAAITLVTRELAENSDADAESRDRLRREQSARLDTLLTGIMPKGSDPNDPEMLPAARTAVTIIDRLCRLHGLDAPTEIAVHSPTATEIDQWVSTMVATQMPELEEPDIIDAEVIE